MPFAAALSEHPLPTHAVGEVVGQVLEALGEGPQLAALFVTGPHAGALEDIVGTVRATLQPGCLIGCAASSVVGGHREVEESAAISLWAARLPSDAGVRPVRLDALPFGDTVRVTGLAGVGSTGTLLTLVDPFSFPVEGLFDQVAVRHGVMQVVGGMASSGRGPGGSRLVLDGDVLTDGAVGVVLDGASAPSTLVSQGCRPIGAPFTVTRAERNVLYELGGRPALERLMEMVDALPPEERALAARGLHCGLVINESKLDFARGDFLIRNVLGGDRSVGAVAVGAVVEVGATVQFQVRDALTAGEDLSAVLDGAEADGALLFTCNGRGTHLFGQPDYDATLVAEGLGTEAVGGMSCAGELGPVGGRNYLHSFTASVAMFTDRAGSSPAAAG